MNAKFKGAKMMLKRIKYYLNTDATQRAQDRADFKQLVHDAKEKEARVKDMEHALVCSGEHIGATRGIFDDLLDNTDTCCAAFQPEIQRPCRDKECPHLGENHKYFDAFRAYGAALVKEKEFWPDRRALRIAQAARAQQERNTEIAHLNAQCADLENELTLAKSAISTHVCINPDSGPLVKMGCFVSAYYGAGDWPILGLDEPSHSFTVNEKCTKFAMPCERNCPYREKNAHYADVLNRYDAACAAYRAIAGKDWIPTKTK